ELRSALQDSHEDGLPQAQSMTPVFRGSGTSATLYHHLRAPGADLDTLGGMTTRKRKRGLSGCLDTAVSALVILFPVWVLLCLAVVTMTPTVWRILEASGALGVRLDGRWAGL